MFRSVLKVKNITWQLYLIIPEEDNCSGEQTTISQIATYWRQNKNYFKVMHESVFGLVYVLYIAYHYVDVSCYCLMHHYSLHIWSRSIFEDHQFDKTINV